MASALIVSPVIIHALGVDAYGVWILAVSIAGYAELLDLGFSLAAVRYYSRAIGSDDPQVLGSLFQFLRRHYRRLGGALILVAAGLFTFDRTQGQSLGSPTVLLIISILVAVNGFGFLVRPHSTLLKARLEYGKIIGTGILRLSLFTAIIWLLGRRGLNLWMVLGLQAALQVVEQLILYAWARPIVPPTAAAASLPPEERSGFLRFAGQIALGGLTTVLRQRIDTQLLGWFSTLSSISHYSIGSRLPLLFFDFLNAIFGGHLMAGFSQLAAKGDTANLHATLFRMLRLSAMASVVGGCGLYVFGPTFIGIWLGPNFAASYPVLQMLTVGMVVTALHFPVFPYLGAINAYGVFVKVSLVTAALNFACSFVLVQRMGLMGVVWGTVIEQMVWGFVLWPLLVAREAGLPLSRYLKVVFLQSALPVAITAYPLCVVLDAYVQPRSYLQLGICGIGVAAYAGAIAWWGILTSAERGALLARAGLRKPA